MVLCKTFRNRAKIKFYMGVKGTGLEDADKKLEELTDAVSEIVGL